MTLTACILVFISAITHITWNFLGKDACSNTKSFALASFFVIFIFSPILFIYKNNLSDILKFWYYIIPSGFFLALSYWGILFAYRFGELSFIYPLKNSQPIIFTTVFALFTGKISTISLYAILGFFLIFLGCIFLPIKSESDFKIKKYINKSTVFTSLAAIGSAGYSIIDSEVLKDINSLTNISTAKIALIYIPVLYFSCSVFLFLFMLIDNTILQKNTYKTKVNIKLLLIVSLCLCFTYILLFISYNYVDNVSYVVAFRQIGLPMSILIGYFLLNEKIYFGKLFGGLLIIMGLIITSIF